MVQSLPEDTQDRAILIAKVQAAMCAERDKMSGIYKDWVTAITDLELTKAENIELLEKLAQQSAMTTDAKPDAWSYELAMIRNDAGEYYAWRKYLTDHEPCAPEGSIRNLVPLYALKGSSDV